MKRWMLVAVLMCGTALFSAAPASAHSELVSSDPPADVTLEFAPIGVGLIARQWRRGSDTAGHRVAEVVATAVDNAGRPLTGRMAASVSYSERVR